MTKYRLVLLCFLIAVVATGLFSIPQAKAAYEYELILEWGSDESDDALAGIRDEHPSDSGISSAEGFSFTTTSGFRIGYLQVRLEKKALPTAYMVSALYAESGGLPTGNVLAYSDLRDSSGFSTDPSWVTFNYSSSNFELSGSTNYVLTIEANTSNVDLTNYVAIYFTSNTTASYGRVRYTVAGWGSISTAYDTPFRLYSIKPDVFITYYYTSGGEFRVNNTILVNGSEHQYSSGENIEFMALPANSSYRFINYSWTSGNSTNNPYVHTATANRTVWLYYEIIVPSVAEPKLFIGVMLLGLGFALPIILVWNKKKRS